jgi:hypothetical protein
MSTNTTPPTASELLAEWKNIQKVLRSKIDPRFLPLGPFTQKRIDSIRIEQETRISGIAAQLDQMCEDAGIYHRDGFPQFRNVDGQTIVGKHGPVSLSELIPLLEWLLIRKNH